MRQIFFNYPGAMQWVADKIPYLPNYRHDTVISMHDDGLIIGAVAYSDYNGASCAGNIAATDRRWLTPDMLWVTFHYPFIQLNCQRLFGKVPTKNTHALAFDLKLGFEIEHCVKGAYQDDDMFILAMDRANCRWLKIHPRRFQMEGTT